MKKILITGSTRGVGLSIASNLIKDSIVIFHGSSDESIDMIRENFKDDRAYFLSHDLRDTDPEKLIDRALEYTDIDILVNNCAIAKKREESDETMHLNFVVPYKLTKYAIKKGIQTIINISSLGAILYDKDLSDYCLTKACIEDMTKHLAYNYEDAIIACIRIDKPLKTDMSANIYPELYESFDDPSTIVPLFQKIISMGQKCSGKIYSYQKSLTNLESEIHLTSYQLSDDLPSFPENIEGRHVCNGENKFAGSGAQYPRSESLLRLEKEISRLSNISKDHIVINHGGISGAFDGLCSQLIGQGDEVICHTLCFPPMISSITKRGGILKTIQPKFRGDFRLEYDLDKIPSMINSATRMIFLVHPTYLFNDIFDNDIFEDMLSKIPTNIPIILDECYYEYLSDTNILHSGVLLDKHLVFGLRTFSKMYGLASTRLGYVLCPARYKSFIQSGFPFKNIPEHSLNIVYTSLEKRDYKISIDKFINARDEFQSSLRKHNVPFWGVSMLQVVYVDPQKKKKVIENLSCKDIIIPEINISDELILYTLGDKIHNKIFINTII